jgi:WD40 repeat protein
LYYLDVKDEKNGKIGRVDTEGRNTDRQLDLGPRVVAMALSPDGKTVYAAASDHPYDTQAVRQAHHTGTLSVIDAASFTRRSVVPVPTAPYDIAAADNRVFLGAGSNQSTRMIVVKDNTAEILTEAPINYRGDYLGLSADQKSLYLATRLLTPSCLESYDLRPGIAADQRTRARVHGVTGEATGSEILITPDGRFLICKGGAVFSLLGFKQTAPPAGAALVALKVHQRDGVPPSSVEAVAFTRDGRLLAAASEEVIKVWDAKTHELCQTLRGHEHWVKRLAFSPDGKQLVSACWARPIKIWDVVAGKELRTLNRHWDAVCGVAFSPDGKYLASGGSKDEALLWNATDFSELAALQLPRDESPLAVAFSPDGKRLAAGSVLWDLDEILQRQPDTFRLHFKNQKAHSTKGTRALVLKIGREDTITSVVYSPDGKVLATGHEHGKAVLWDALTGQELVSMRPHRGWVNALAFSADSKLLAVAGNRDEVLHLREIPSGKILASLQLDQQQATWPLSAAFSPDGKRLAVGTSQGEVLFWDVEQALRRQGKAAPGGQQ